MARSDSARGGLLAILAGIAAGVATSLWLAPGAPPRSEPPQGPARAAPQTVVTHRIHQVEAPQRHQELEDLKERISWLERAAPEGAAAGSPEPEPPSPEEARARIIQAQQDALEAHRRQPVDAPWAEDTAHLLHEDLGGLGHGEGWFQVLDVDCRTSTCAAEVEWPSYQAAVERYARVLHQPYRANCARRVVLPEPAHGPAAPYRATILFDCGP